ncbi:lasso peptide biosynthesis PqqD family chaperone [Streptomyces koelreuteriae]|uniref:Lasso peptide biosynthesis PqqD family chaperone n=1 Tax=Streptomyces koelreuteriae TaxID=2838015 RepID=A0ABX8FZX3_9ACTN|nr:lasso peptide biosynthesis PqqD family chaperone [Streptomyces koelreuteriae]
MRLHPDVSTTDTDDGTVLLNERTGRYWQLNNTGAHVLHRLLDGREPAAIAADLADRYGIEPQQAERDVTAVIERLLGSKLVIS